MPRLKDLSVHWASRQFPTTLKHKFNISRDLQPNKYPYFSSSFCTSQKPSHTPPTTSTKIHNDVHPKEATFTHKEGVGDNAVANVRALQDQEDTNRRNKADITHTKKDDITHTKKNDITHSESNPNNNETEICTGAKQTFDNANPTDNTSSNDTPKSNPTSPNNTENIATFTQAAKLCMAELQPFFGSTHKCGLNLYRWLSNKVSSALVLMFCYPDVKRTYFTNDVLRGARQALQFLMKNLSEKEFDKLSDVVEENLIKKFKSIYKHIDESDYKVNFDTQNIESAYIYNLNMIFGVKRGAQIPHQTKVLYLISTHHFLVPSHCFVNHPTYKMVLSEAECPYPLLMDTVNENKNYKAPDEDSSPVSDCIRAGRILRLDVVLKTKQNVRLESKEDKNDFYEFMSTVNHLLRFEMPIDASDSNLHENSSTRYKLSNWKLVDYNNIMKGNYPIDYSYIENVTFQEKQN